METKLLIERFWFTRSEYYGDLGRMISVVATAICVLVVSSCSASSVPIVRVVPGGEVMLAPQISAGWAGWCMAVVTQGSRRCEEEPGTSGSIFSESWSTRGSVTIGAALTTNEVVEVSVDGSRPVPTRRPTAVAGALGLRSVIIEIQSKKIRTEDNKSYPHFTPLDAKEIVIRQHSKPGVSLGFNIPVRRWQHSQHAPHGVCGLRTDGWPGLSARWGAVVIEVKRSYSDLLGRPFLSCASTEYFHEAQPVEAGILLDALHPGTEPPPLPAVKAVPGHPGIFQAQGAAGEGQMLGRRVAHAWLVVEEGGSTFKERLALLEHLQATVSVGSA